MRSPQTLESLETSTLTAIPRLLGLDLERAEHLRRRLLPLDDQALIDMACRQTGLSDFGGERFREGLRRLLISYDEDACLSLIGRIAARQDTLRLLKTRLRLQEDRKRFPGIADQVIRRPIFIAGLPRSGTTLLHSLLAQDPANRVPLTWEVMFPSPPPERAGYQTDPRIAKTERMLRWLDRLAPGFRAIHPLGAQLPQECVAITSYAFESPQFHTTHNVASYQAWLADRDQHEAYGFHRCMLQHLQWRCPAQRWVLKAPAHLFALDALFGTYPDARIVQTHRDPLEVLPSTASLTAALHRAFSRSIDPRGIGEEVTRRWAQGVRHAMTYRKLHPHLRERFFDVDYRDLVGKPMATLHDLYEHFGLPWTAEAEARMEAFLAANPKNKNGRHRYRLAQFDLAADRIRHSFRDYRAEALDAVD